MEYNFKEVEKKWQSYWKENQTYKVDVELVQTEILCTGDVP